MIRFSVRGGTDQERHGDDGFGTLREAREKAYEYSQIHPGSFSVFITSDLKQPLSSFERGIETTADPTAMVDYFVTQIIDIPGLPEAIVKALKGLQ